MKRGWTKARLKEVIEPRGVKILPSSRPELRFIGMEHVEAQTMRILGSVPATELKSAGAHFLPHDVLYGRLRPYLNKVAKPDFEGIASAEFIVLPDKEHLRSGFLQYRLNARDFVNFASRINAGDRPRVDFDQISEFEIELPPAPEQARIVAKVDELISDLDASVTSLKRARANLKRYRAAVLKAAFEGKLTAEWRKSNPPSEPADNLLERILVERRKKWDEVQLAKYSAQGKQPPKGWKEKYSEPMPAETAQLPQLPEGWCWATLSQLGFLDRGKSRHRPRNASFLFGGSYPFIQTGEIGKSDTFIREYGQTYSEAGLQQSRLWPSGTLCITIAANIAETAILSFDACFPDSIVGFLPASEHVSIRYVELYLRTMQARLESLAPATAQKNINLDVLQQVAICLPPVAEQLNLVATIDQHLSLAAQVTMQSQQSLARAARLRQSILKRAFEGKLVPQDPNDEPASVLLERIRATRAEDAMAGKRPAAQRRGGEIAAKGGPRMLTKAERDFLRRDKAEVMQMLRARRKAT